MYIILDIIPRKKSIPRCQQKCLVLTSYGLVLCGINVILFIDIKWESEQNHSCFFPKVSHFINKSMSNEIYGPVSQKMSGAIGGNWRVNMSIRKFTSKDKEITKSWWQATKITSRNNWESHVVFQLLLPNVICTWNWNRMPIKIHICLPSV